ncbi:MAG: glycosyltransferase family 39 protein [Alphaproteobacteria bacterium]
MLALGALLLLPGLGGHPLVDPTEARHAAVAREMAREGRLLVPSLYGEPYYDKPSPYYLLLRAARHLPLGTEAALRIPSVVATLATAALLFGFARRRTGALAASVGTAIFLACPLVVVLGRFADQDAPLSALLTAAVVGLLSALDDPSRRLGLVAVAMGLGSWVKGPVAIVLPSVVAAVVAASRRTLPDPAVLRRAAGALAVACAIFAAWVVPAWFADPDYVSSFLLRHNVGRFAEASTGHAKPAWFYVPTMLGAMLPWSLLLPAAIAAGSRRGEAVREGERELLAWAAAIVVFYSLSRAKSAGYVLPAVGPRALWLGSRLVAIAGADAARTVEAPDETEDPHGAVRTADLSWDSAAARLPDPLVDDTPAARRVEFLLRAALGALAAIAVVAPVAAWIALRREAAPLAASGLLLLLPLALVGLLAARAAWREPRPLRATAAWTGLFAACLFATAYLRGRAARGATFERPPPRALRRGAGARTAAGRLPAPPGIARLLLAGAGAQGDRRRGGEEARGRGPDRRARAREGRTRARGGGAPAPPLDRTGTALPVRNDSGAAGRGAGCGLGFDLGPAESPSGGLRSGRRPRAVLGGRADATLRLVPAGCARDRSTRRGREPPRDLRPALLHQGRAARGDGRLGDGP